MGTRFFLSSSLFVSKTVGRLWFASGSPSLGQILLVHCHCEKDFLIGLALSSPTLWGDEVLGKLLQHIPAMGCFSKEIGSEDAEPEVAVYSEYSHFSEVRSLSCVRWL